MKLGYIAVYLVSERNERLLDVHFDQIEKYTEVDYHIYGSAVRLLPRFMPKLESHPKLTVCPVEPYVETGEEGRRYEHSWYLEQLIRFAFDDGCTHVVVVHVDAFPVRSGWVTELVEQFDDECVMAGIMRDEKIDRKPMSACMLIPREFWSEYQPRMLLTEEELASPEYARYQEEVPHETDSGFGYGFTMHRHGLDWVPLVRSNVGQEHELYGSIYGDMFFHLHGAMQMENSPEAAFRNKEYKRGVVRRAAGAAAKLVLPAKARAKLRENLPQKFAEPEQYFERMAFEEQREQLLSDPDAYIRYLRTGLRQ